jgi:hypothetical protein
LSPLNFEITIVSGPSRVKFNNVALPAVSASVSAVISMILPSSTPKERDVEGDLGRAVKCNSSALEKVNVPSVADSVSLSEETLVNALKSTISVVASSSRTISVAD